MEKDIRFTIAVNEIPNVHDLDNFARMFPEIQELSIEPHLLMMSFVLRMFFMTSPTEELLDTIGEKIIAQSTDILSIEIDDYTVELA